jgi:hypothetical protein
MDLAAKGLLLELQDGAFSIVDCLQGKRGKDEDTGDMPICDCGPGQRFCFADDLC